jgi:hypothetical protein
MKNGAIVTIHHSLGSHTPDYPGRASGFWGCGGMIGFASDPEKVAMGAVEKRLA